MRLNVFLESPENGKWDNGCRNEVENNSDITNDMEKFSRWLLS